MTSTHPSAIEWKPAKPRAGYFNQVIGRTTSWECRLGSVYQTVTGVWQATRHPNIDCGEHKTRQAAMRAVEQGEPHD